MFCVYQCCSLRVHVCVCVSPRVETVMRDTRWGAAGVWRQDRRWRRAVPITHSPAQTKCPLLATVLMTWHVIKSHIAGPPAHSVHTHFQRNTHYFPAEYLLCLCLIDAFVFIGGKDNSVIRNRQVRLDFSNTPLHNCILISFPSKWSSHFGQSWYKWVKCIYFTD